MDIGLFDFDLPPERIAQHPSPERDGSRLLVLDRKQGTLRHHRFRDLPALLSAGDVLVVNETRVIPARLSLKRSTGGRVEALFLRPQGAASCLVMLDSGGRLKPGETLSVEPGGARVRLIEPRGAGEWLAAIEEGSVEDLLRTAGRMPLPPYIRRARPVGGAAPPQGEEAAATAASDRERYQTVYAREPGAVAAPTAGLHFTRETFEELAVRGVAVARLTLHVGPGTFRPIRAHEIEEHRVEAEEFALSAEAAEAVDAARERGGRVIAVGTTTVRVLESRATGEGGRVAAGHGETDLFIYPPFRFRVVDGLVTNFHLPKSSLLVLVAALAGREAVLRAYLEAIREGYRFYSYGDAMLIL